MPESNRLTVLERVLALLTSLVGLITASLGFVACNANQDKDAANSELLNQNRSLTSLSSAYAAERSANSDLSSKLLTAAHSTLTLTTTIRAESETDPEFAGSVRHQGQVILAPPRSSADLDASAADANWIGSNGIKDFGFDGSQFFIGKGVKILELGESVADYRYCSDNQADFYDHPELTLEVFPVGEYLCLMTDQGRFVALQLKAVSGDIATLDATSYNHQPDRPCPRISDLISGLLVRSSFRCSGSQCERSP